jgi:SAM-dependent methyltransferase
MRSSPPANASPRPGGTSPRKTVSPDESSSAEHEAALPRSNSPAATSTPPQSAAVQDIDIVEAYELDDTDSAFDAGSAFSDTTSLYSDIVRYRVEHGRRYHGYKDGSYWGPNDEKQNNQLDLAHNLYLLTLDGQLFLAPIGDSPQNVLDIGTGTGIWAMDFADQYPSAQVIGFDLSPIQPNWTPPNVRFEVNDACDPDWGYRKNGFDFIHVRAMYGSVAEWPAFYQQVLV